MESWTWGDAVVYSICVALKICTLPLLQAILVLIRLPPFLFVKLPWKLVREFSVTTWERRNAERSYGTFFEFVVIAFIRWALECFTVEVAHEVFLSKFHALALYNFRVAKYGCDNIGDFSYRTVSAQFTQGSSNPGHVKAGTEQARPLHGYWVASRSRRDSHHDLVIYFVPGMLMGAASSYFYIEFLSILLGELQVRGFRNPAVFCLDYEFPRNTTGTPVASFMKSVAEGWQYVVSECPDSKTLFFGSGIGGTAMLSLLLHFANPFIKPSPGDRSGTAAELLNSALGAGTRVAEARRSEGETRGFNSRNLFKALALDHASLHGHAYPQSAASVHEAVELDRALAEEDVVNDGSLQTSEALPELEKTWAEPTSSHTEAPNFQGQHSAQDIGRSRSADTVEVSETESQHTERDLKSEITSGASPVSILRSSDEAHEQQERCLDPLNVPRNDGEELPSHCDTDSEPIEDGDSDELIVPVLPKPDALLLLSPVTRISPKLKRKEFTDVLSTRAVNQAMRRISSSEEADCPWTMPGCIQDEDWWSEALPRLGSIFFFGGQEILSKEIREFSSNLSEIQGIKFLHNCPDDGLHSWPIANSFLARTGTLQVDGICRVADQIAKMLVMECLCSKIKKC